MQELSGYDSSGILAKQIKFAKGTQKPSDEINDFFTLANNESKGVFVALANQDAVTKKAKEHDDFWHTFREENEIDEDTPDEQVRNTLLVEIFVKESIPKLQSIAFSVKDEIPVSETETLDGLKRETIIQVEGKINKINKRNQCLIVTKLEREGGIFVAKTAQAIFGINTTGENGNYPQLENPITRGHVTGGSSSGAGYIAGSEKYKNKILVNITSDAGGSTRIPAHNNRSHGFKPTRNRIDKKNYNNVFRDLCEIGAITQCNYDTALIYMILSGQYPAISFDEIKDLNIVLEKEAFLASDKTMALKTLKTIKQLQQTRTDHRISFIEGGIFENKEQFEIAANGFYLTFSNNAYNGHKQFINAKGLPAVENLQLICGGSINQGVLNTAKDNQKLLTHRANNVLSGATVSLSPTTLAKIPKRTVFKDNHQGELNFGKEYSQSAITSIHNQAGTPSLQIPIGTTQDKYPLGLCISSAAGSGYLVIYVANLLIKAKAKID